MLAPMQILVATAILEIERAYGTAGDRSGGSVGERGGGSGRGVFFGGGVSCSVVGIVGSDG